MEWDAIRRNRVEQRQNRVEHRSNSVEQGGTTIFRLYFLPGCQFTIELAASYLFTVRSVNAWEIGGTGWNTSGAGWNRVEQSGTGWNIGGTGWNKVEQRDKNNSYFLAANSRSNCQPEA